MLSFTQLLGNLHSGTLADLHNARLWCSLSLVPWYTLTHFLSLPTLTALLLPRTPTWTNLWGPVRMHSVVIVICFLFPFCSFSLRSLPFLHGCPHGQISGVLLECILQSYILPTPFVSSPHSLLCFCHEQPHRQISGVVVSQWASTGKNIQGYEFH